MSHRWSGLSPQLGTVVSYHHQLVCVVNSTLTQDSLFDFLASLENTYLLTFYLAHWALGIENKNAPLVK